MLLRCFAKTVFYKFWLLLMQAVMVEEAMMVVLLLEVGVVVAVDSRQVSHFHTTQLLQLLLYRTRQCDSDRSTQKCCSLEGFGYFPTG